VCPVLCGPRIESGVDDLHGDAAGHTDTDTDTDADPHSDSDADARLDRDAGR
jgi:hypothetical protein